MYRTETLEMETISYFARTRNKSYVCVVTLILLCILLIFQWKSDDSSFQSAPRPIRTEFRSTDCGCVRNYTTIKPTDSESKSPGYHWCSYESTLRGTNQKIVSFSIFGKADEKGLRYYSLLNENAVAVNQLLPGINF